MKLSPNLFFLFLIVCLKQSYSQNPWLQKSNFGGTARFGGTGFSIDSLGYICMGYNSTIIYKDLWEYNSINNSWTQKADCPGSSRRAPVSFSINGKGYVGTGYGSTLLKDFWEYNPSSNSWLQKADFGGAERYGCIAFSISGKGYIGLGNMGTSSGPFANDIFEYDPVSNIWSQKANFPAASRYGAIGFTDGINGYVTCGGNASVAYNDMYQFDPSLNLWTQKTSFPGSARSYPFAFCIGNYGYVGGGNNNNIFFDFYSYSINSDTWLPDTTYPGGSGYASSFFSIGIMGYVGTGGNSNTFFNDFWEYSPCEKVYTPYITADGPTTFCQGDSIILTCSSANSYLWSNGVTTQSIIVKNSGNYSVMITEANSCLASSSPITINVNPLPITPTIFQNGNLLACSESSMASYQWYLNGFPNLNCPGQFCNCIQDGFYSVIITDGNGCSASSPLSNVFCSVGSDELSSEISFKIFPNPNNGKFLLNLQEMKLRISRIKIYNILGEIVFNSFLTADQASVFIDISSQVPGIYWIQLTGEKLFFQSKIELSN